MSSPKAEEYWRRVHDMVDDLGKLYLVNQIDGKLVEKLAEWAVQIGVDYNQLQRTVVYCGAEYLLKMSHAEVARLAVLTGRGMDPYEEEDDLPF